jgi:hypothetical protein
MPNNPNAAVAYRFHAHDLHIVMSPATPGAFARYGQLTGAANGIDDELGAGTVAEQCPYQPTRQPKPIADRQFEIEFLGSGVELLHSPSVSRLPKMEIPKWMSSRTTLWEDSP